MAIEFLEPVESIVAKLPPVCKKVTHAYYTSYVHTDDFTKLRDLNVPLFEHFLTAIDTVAGENLQRICLQTGGKVPTPHSHCYIVLGPEQLIQTFGIR